VINPQARQSERLPVLGANLKKKGGEMMFEVIGIVVCVLIVVAIIIILDINEY
jgi:hypothetical protein